MAVWRSIHDEVDDQADLYQLGMTSHASVDVMLALEDAFDIEFPDEVLKKSTFASVHNITQVIEGLVNCQRDARSRQRRIGEFPWRRGDYGESMITLPGEIDGRRVRVGCDVVAIEEVQDSLAAFGDRYLRKVFTANEINDCQGRNRVHSLAARFAAKEAVIKAFAEPDMAFPLREIEVTRNGPLPLLRLSGGSPSGHNTKAGSARLCRFRTPTATQWPSFSWSVVRPSPTLTPGRDGDDFWSISDLSSGWASPSARFRCKAACCGSSWSHSSSPACWCCCPSESEYAAWASVAATALPGRVSSPVLRLTFRHDLTHIATRLMILRDHTCYGCHAAGH